MALNLKIQNKSLNIGVFLLLCAKFYFLWGMTDMPRPDAPLAVILIRDLIVFGFLFYFGTKVFRQSLGLKFFWGFWVFGLVISLFHLSMDKSWAIWGQHYLRNVLVPLLFYPVFYGLFKNKIQIPIHKILVCIFLITASISIFQLVYLRMTRPTGIFGDPIINTMMLSWGFLAVLSFAKKRFYIPALILLLPVLFFSSAVSALFSVCAGGLMQIGLNYKMWKDSRRKIFSQVAVGSIIIFGCFWLLSEFALKNKLQNNSDALFVKSSAIFDAITCEGENCNTTHWSYRGRIWSNKRPIELCQQDTFFCLFGQYKNPMHIRLESTWGFLAVNWGMIFCLLFVYWIFSHFRNFRQDLLCVSEDKNICHLWSVIFFSSLFFLIFNTIVHKYPVNILFYASMAYLQARREVKNEISSRD